VEKETADRKYHEQENSQTTMKGSDGVQAIFSNAGDDLGNLSSSQILWNACNSTNIQISAFHLYGSLLAPFSTVTLNNGQQVGWIAPLATTRALTITARPEPRWRDH